MHYCVSPTLPSISSPLSLHYSLRITHLVTITSANSHNPNKPPYYSAGFSRKFLIGPKPPPKAGSRIINSPWSRGAIIGVHSLSNSTVSPTIPTTRGVGLLRPFRLRKCSYLKSPPFPHHGFHFVAPTTNPLIEHYSFLHWQTKLLVYHDAVPSLLISNFPH